MDKWALTPLTWPAPAEEVGTSFRGKGNLWKSMEIHGNPPVCEHQMNLSTHEIGDTDYIISTNHEKTQTDSTVNDHFFQ